MYRGTTPTFIFTFPEEFDPTLAQSVILTFSANKKDAILEKTEQDLQISSQSIQVSLTQEETLLFPSGRIYYQINFYYGNGQRISTDIQLIVFEYNLHNKVME